MAKKRRAVICQPREDFLQRMRLRTVFTTGQIAAMCEVAPRTVAKWCDSDKLKNYRIPGSQDRRVSSDDLVKFLKQNEMPCHGLDWQKRRAVLMTTQQRMIECATEEAGNVWAVNHCSTMFSCGYVAAEFRPQILVVDGAMGFSQCVEAYRFLSVAGRGLSGAVAVYDEDDTPQRWLDVGFRGAVPWPLSKFSLRGVMDQVLTAVEAERAEETRKKEREMARQRNKARRDRRGTKDAAE